MPELTQEQKDEGARDYYKMAFEASVKASVLFQEDVTKTAWNEKDVITPAGRLVAVFDADEYHWLEDQYGAGICRNREFVLDYRKFRNQDFLAVPSSTFGTS
tara:strand:+ start:2419 stop:2724 length:306 start_codon:yes stop_codon:yes gene_type:complete